MLSFNGLSLHQEDMALYLSDKDHVNEGVDGIADVLILFEGPVCSRSKNLLDFLLLNLLDNGFVGC